MTPHPTPRLSAILRRAEEIAVSRGHGYVGVEHVQLAILEDPGSIPTQIIAQLVDPGEVTRRLDTLMNSESYNTPTTRARRIGEPR